jgi:hypothetical protein
MTYYNQNVTQKSPEKIELDNFTPYLKKKLDPNGVKILNNFLNKEVANNITIRSLFKKIEDITESELKIRNITCFFQAEWLSSRPPFEIIYENTKEINLKNYLEAISEKFKVTYTHSKNFEYTTLILEDFKIKFISTKLPFGNRHDSIDNIEELKPKEEIIYYPKYSPINPKRIYKIYGQFQKEKNSGWIGCTGQLEQLEAKFVYFIAKCTEGYLPEEGDQFFDKLYENLFKRYETNQENFAKNVSDEIEQFFEEMVPEKKIKLRLSILLNMAFLVYPNCQNKESEKKQQVFFQIFWKIIFSQIKKSTSSVQDKIKDLQKKLINQEEKRNKSLDEFEIFKNTNQKEIIYL